MILPLLLLSINGVWGVDNSFSVYFNKTNVITNGYSYLKLNGLNADVNFGNNDNISIKNNVSICSWIKLNSKNAVSYPFGKGSGGQYEYALLIDTAGNLDMRTYNANGDIQNSIPYNVFLSNDKWYFICSVISNNSFMQLFYQGRLASEDTSFSGNIGYGTATLRVGSRSGSNYFNGAIGGFSFWDKTVNVASIAELYTSDPRASSDRYIPIVMLHAYNETGIPSYMGLNRTQLDTLLNYLNNSNYTTITDLDYLNYTKGLITLPQHPIILSWDDGYLGMMDAANIMAGYGYKSVAAIVPTWVNTNGFVSWENVSKLVNVYNWSIASHSYSHCNHLTSCNLTINWTNEMTLSKSAIIANISYTPISYIYPGNDQNASTHAICDDYYSICFGYAKYYGTPRQVLMNFKDTNLTDGHVWRVEISNQTDYNKIDLLLNYSYNLNIPLIKTTFDENIGPKIFDLSGHGLNGTISNGIWANNISYFKNNDTLAKDLNFTSLTSALISLSNGTGFLASGDVNISLDPSQGRTVINQSWLDFDGVNDKVTLTNSTLLSPYANNNITTFSMWVNIKDMVAGDGSDGRHYLLNKGTSNGNYEYQLVVTNYTKGSIYMKLLNSGASASNLIYLKTTTNPYERNRWYNLIFTLNGTEINGYLDGNYIDYNNITVLNNTGDKELIIGNLASVWFNGSVDDFRIYNKSFSPSQISQLYNSFSRSRSNKTIPVFMYHNLGDSSASDYTVNETQFTDQMNYFNSSGFMTITDKEYYNWTQNQGFIMPEKPMILTFDDGDISTINNISVIMARYGYKGVASITTSWIGTPSYMSWANVSTLISQGWSIASHSQTHCRMTSSTSPSCNTQDTRMGNMSASKVDIISNTGFTPISMIYPYNDWSTSSMADCELNYSLCFGWDYPTSRAVFINKESGAYTGILRRIKVSNITTVNDLQYALNYTLPSLGQFANLQLDETTGSTAYDSSGKGNNGTISGATWNFTYWLDTSGANSVYVFDNAKVDEANPVANFPIWFSSASNKEKHIASNLTENITLPVSFLVSDCKSAGKITYTSNTKSVKQTFFPLDYSCSDNQVTLNLMLEQAQNSNEINIEYGCDSFTFAGYRILGLFMGLIIPVSTFVFIRRKGWENIEMGDIVIIAVSIIIGATLYLNSSQILGSTCGVINV